VLRSVIIAAIGAWLAAAIILTFVQERILFPGAFQLPNDATARARLTQTAQRVGAAEQHIITDDGVRLLTWHYDYGDRSRLVLYMPGNGEDIPSSVHHARAVQREGYGFLTAAPRGFPGSDGAPSQEGFVRDLMATWRHATEELGYPARGIILHGRSMGGGIVGQLMQDLPSGGVVMESTYDSVSAMASRRYPLLPTGLFLRHPFDTLAHAPAVTQPVLQVHSRDDKVIPIARARKLSAAWRDATYVEVEGLEHNQSALLAAPEAHAAWVELLRRTGSPAKH
jgi:alpha-beta hydrolase superfamily lysophospholipase